jgi:hypothetical protein
MLEDFSSKLGYGLGGGGGTTSNMLEDFSPSFFT